MKGFKKLTAAVLGAVMALSVMSFTAFAEDAGNVAKIGDTEYATLQAAIDDGDGKTVKLIADTDENVVIADNQDITIDLNGFTLNGGTNNGSKPAIKNMGTLIIKDSDGDGVIKREDVDDKAYYVIDNQGTMTIKGGTIINDSGAEVNGNINGSSLIRNGGNSSKENGYAVLNIEGGTYKQDNFIAIKNDDHGELNMTGGTVSSKNESAIQNWAKADITGGKINGLVYTLTWSDDFGNSETKLGGDVKVEGTIRTELYDDSVTTVPKVVIDGGKFDVDWVIPESLAEHVNVVNGSFSNKVPEDYLDKDSNLVKDKNGNYVVMDEEEYKDYKKSEKKSSGSSYSLEEGKASKKDDEKKEEPVVTPEEKGPFYDVSTSDPNYDAIIKVYEKGWMVGVSDGVFAANGTLTRGMAATILWNKAGKPEPVNVSPFLDVTGDAYYAKAVAWAYEQGIVLGYDGTTFGPNDFVTTEQFTIMLDKSNGSTPAAYVGGAPNATRGWVAGMIA